MLKISLLFIKNTNLTGKKLENSKESERKIFRIFLYEHKHGETFESALAYL